MPELLYQLSPPVQKRISELKFSAGLLAYSINQFKETGIPDNSEIVKTYERLLKEDLDAIKKILKRHKTKKA